jgi:predicted GTPase
VALVIEDGPTLTHRSMAHGAGFVAARAAGATIVDPRPAATPPIAEVLARYPHVCPVLPALGYGPAQLDALRATIEAVDADVVVAATPADLGRLIRVDKPIVRARYEFAEACDPGLGVIVDGWLETHSEDGEGP